MRYDFGKMLSPQSRGLSTRMSDLLVETKGNPQARQILRTQVSMLQAITIKEMDDYSTAKDYLEDEMDRFWLLSDRFAVHKKVLESIDNETKVQ